MKRSKSTRTVIMILLILGISASGAYIFFRNASEKNLAAVDTPAIVQQSLATNDQSIAKVDRTPTSSSQENASLKSQAFVVERPAEKFENEPVPLEPAHVALAKSKSEKTEAATLQSYQKSEVKQAPLSSTEPASPPPVSATELIPQDSTTDPNLEKLWPKFWLWAGSGMNFQYYRQSIPGIEGESTFQNIQGPTAQVRAGFLGKTMGMDISIKDTPGKMASSSTLKVTNGDYHWQTLSVEGLYKLPSQWLVKFGIQHHAMPFMVLDAATATIDVKANSLSMLTLGFDRSFFLAENLRAEWGMHYQHPVLSGSSDGTPFSVAPQLAFDGSVGAVYSLAEKQRLGVYWYGQWHEYKFTYGRGAAEISGQQTLFYSSIELRYGIEF